MTDEQLLWDSFPNQHKWPRDAAKQLGINAKRARYLCLKWARKGIYDYGVSADLGWKVSR